MQITLIVFGSRRKISASIRTRICVWFAYMMADWVAAFVLGNLLSSPPNSEANSSITNDALLRSFWTPFLLLHLGGPDTITAYSLEDNELWLRHFLGFIVQVVVVFYVFFQSWSNEALTFISIPMFVSGVIKYGERTFALWSSSAANLKDSLLSKPDPGPYFLKIDRAEEKLAERRRQREEQQQSSWLANMIDRGIYNSGEPKELTVIEPEKLEADASSLEVADFLFRRFKYLFADLILGYYERRDSCSIIENRSAEDAFKLVATELGFMFDLLYTKAAIVYSMLGIIFRFICFFSSVIALVLFSTIVNVHDYSSIDVSITYALLVGAVVLEFYAFCVLFFSDWVALWYSRIVKSYRDVVGCAPFTCSSSLPNRKRWSRSMAQYNLLDFCLYNIRPRIFGVDQLPWVGELLEQYQCLTWEDVTIGLEEIIFRQLLEKNNELKDGNYDMELCSRLLAQRGDYVLEKKFGLEARFDWSTTKVEFDRSLLLWHIATDLCYHTDLEDIHEGNVNKLDSKCRISKCLSDYMMYLIVFKPTMLPEGLGEMRYRDTCAEALRFFLDDEVCDCCCSIAVQNRKSMRKIEACRALLQVNFGPQQEARKGDKSQSLLFYGCRLAKQLLEMDSHEKWEVISEVWVEILTYAANKCGWKEHGQQLRKGGELLTHVRLVMTHLGLSEQYQIKKLKFKQAKVKYLRVSRSFVCLCILLGPPLCCIGMISSGCRSLYDSCRKTCCPKKSDTSEV